MAAIRLLQELETANRHATPAEQETLAAWSSWGAVPQIFEEFRDEWANERAELKQLLSPAEYHEASATTVNAHYTDPRIIEQVWGALGRAGFDGGRVLEPGCGVGSFIGLAPESAKMTGVELDSTTARIASFLYPSQQIRAEGFQDTVFPDGAVSAVVGNVPFGNFQVHDPLYNTAGLNIHNYFIAKSLRMTAPGGYVAVLTSTYTMDSQRSTARREIAKYGDLVGAVRLPNNAFKDVAGTEVMTDLVIFRRRKPAEKPNPARIEGWVRNGTTLAQHKETGDDTEVSIGGYFAEHPEDMLGALRVGQGMYSENTLTLAGDTGEELAAALAPVLTGIMDQAAKDGLGYDPDVVQAPESMFTPGLRVKPASVEGRTGEVRFNRADQVCEKFSAYQVWERINVPKNRASETQLLIAVKTAARDVIASQRDSRNESDRLDARATLNRVYDDYVARFGPINRFTMTEPAARTAENVASRIKKKEATWRAGLPTDGQVLPADVPVPAEMVAAWEEHAIEPHAARKQQLHLAFLTGDPDRGVLLSLEQLNEKTQTASKAAIFAQDVLSSRTRPERVETVADALAISLDESRTVDLERIGELLGVDAETARERLGTSVFDDPLTDTLIPAVAYLSGDVRAKHELAVEAAQKDGRYQVNAEALAAVVPEGVSAMDIIARPGVRYVQPEDYEQFVQERFGVAAVVGISPTDDLWEAKLANRGTYSAAVRYAYGTDDRNPLQLLVQVMNNRSIVVRRTEDNGSGGKRSYKDVKATLAARDKAGKIVEDFGTWLFSDAERAQCIVDAYNVSFNSNVVPNYAQLGAAMAFPGLNDAINPHPYQRSVVARILNEPTVLLDHVVGAGKTGSMVMGAMELRRTGIVKKPAIVVPNHIVDQVSSDFMSWYPGAQILTIPTGVAAKDRQFWVSAAATGDWDAVIIPQTVFSKIQIDPLKSKLWLEESIDELRQQVKYADKGERQLIKKLEAAIKRLEAKHAKIVAGKDTGVTFEETGIDYLFIDEAHDFKNLARTSDSYELACVGADRAADLDYKLRSLRESKTELAKSAGYYTPGYLPAVATFATGTPVANALAELWVMQHYLRPDLLARAGLHDVNSWANQFTERNTVLRVSPAGGGYDQVERINKYINVPELLQITNQFSDQVTTDDIVVPLPALEEGGRQLRTREPSLAVREYVKDLGERSKNLSGVDPKDDNMPKITNDGRMVALDPRLKGLSADEDGGRPAQVAAEVWDIHERTKHTVFTDDGVPSPTTGGVQLLFCDRAVPNTEGRFSMYDDIKAELITLGMGEEKIAFIHDAKNDGQRSQLFEKCRTGEINVLIGSTQRMGTGTNVQARALALHHVDVPWRPADLEQREGRILRQGNQNEVVSIRNYATAETFDVYMWDMVARKAKFINQLKGSGLQDRTMMDGFGDLELTASQTAAALSGDPRVEQLGSLQLEQATIVSLHNSYTDTRRRIRGEIRMDESMLASLTQSEPLLAQAERLVVSTSGDSFAMSIDGASTGQRSDAATLINKFFRTRLLLDKNGAVPATVLGILGGMRIEAGYRHYGIELSVAGVPGARIRIPVAEAANSGMGTVRRLENLVASIPGATGRNQDDQEQARERIAESEKALTEPFEHAAKLHELEMAINDLMHAMGITAGEEAESTHEETVNEAGLTALYGETHKETRGNALRVGDIITGKTTGGDKMWRVLATAEKLSSFEVEAVTESDSAETETRKMLAYERYELVQRPVSVLNAMETLLLEVPDTDKATRNKHEVANGEWITVFMAEYDRDRQGGYKHSKSGDPELFTGILTIRQRDWIITDSEGKEHKVHGGHEPLLMPVIRHNVADPEADKAAAAKAALEKTFVHASDFFPGDVLLEDVEHLGKRGDVWRGAIRGSYGSGFVDPHTYQPRKKTGYKARALQYQQGRALTKEEIGFLYDGALPGEIAALHVGDTVLSTDLDKKANRREIVTVTYKGSGTMLDIGYRYGDGEKASARRRDDQGVEILSRRYGSLSMAELAMLQERQNVHEQRALWMQGALAEGAWVYAEAAPGDTPNGARNVPVLGKIITATLTKAPVSPNGYRPADIIKAVLEDAGGNRKSYAMPEHAPIVAWTGGLPETPFDLSGMFIDAGPLPTPTPPAVDPVETITATNDAHPDRDNYIQALVESRMAGDDDMAIAIEHLQKEASERLIIGTVDLPSKTPPTAQTSEPAAPAARADTDTDTVTQPDPVAARIPVPATQPTQEATETEGFELPVLEHTTAGTSVTNTGRGDTVLSEALKNANFKWSARNNLWYLNSRWKPDTRDAKVRHLITALKGQGRAMAMADEFGPRRMSTVTAGEWVMLNENNAHIPGMDEYGMRAKVEGLPPLYGQVTDNNGYQVVVKVKAGTREHELAVRPVESLLTVATATEALEWETATATRLEGLSATLDERMGVKLGQLVPGTVATLRGLPVTIENVDSFGGQRFERVTVLASEPRTDHENYVLIEDQGERLWLTVTDAERIPVHGQEDLHEAGFTAPAIESIAADEVEIGQAISVRGIDPHKSSGYIKTITTASGILTEKTVDGDEVTLTVETRRGPRPVELEQHSDIKTITPGTTEAWKTTILTPTPDTVQVQSLAETPLGTEASFQGLPFDLAKPTWNSFMPVTDVTVLAIQDSPIPDTRLLYVADGGTLDWYVAPTAQTVTLGTVAEALEGVSVPVTPHLVSVDLRDGVPAAMDTTLAIVKGLDDDTREDTTVMGYVATIDGTYVEGRTRVVVGTDDMELHTLWVDTDPAAESVLTWSTDEPAPELAPEPDPKRGPEPSTDLGEEPSLNPADTVEESPAPQEQVNHVIRVDQLQPGHILVNDEGIRARVDRILRQEDRFHVHVTGEQGQQGTVKAGAEKVFTVEPKLYLPEPAREPDVPDMTAMGQLPTSKESPGMA